MSQTAISASSPTPVDRLASASTLLELAEAHIAALEACLEVAADGNAHHERLRSLLQADLTLWGRVRELSQREIATDEQRDES